MNQSPAAESVTVVGILMGSFKVTPDQAIHPNRMSSSAPMFLDDEETDEAVITGAPPRLGSREYEQTAEYVGVKEIAAFSTRKPKTVISYKQKWTVFVSWCETKTPKYNPWLVDYVPELFTLFAGYMFVKGTNLSLAPFQSAFNFIYMTMKLPPAWRGGMITTTVNSYGKSMIARRCKDGTQIAALRVMLPLEGLLLLIKLITEWIVEGNWMLAALGVTCLIMLKLIIRANTVAGWLKEDNRYNEAGSFLSTVRKVKWGRAHIQPFTKIVPPPPASNSIATRVNLLIARVIQESDSENNTFEFSAAGMGITTNNASVVITEFMQTYLPAAEIGVAEGSFISSHSMRITGANMINALHRGDYTRLKKWGGWLSETSVGIYLKRFDPTIPWNATWAAFYYWMEYSYDQGDVIWGAVGYDDEPEAPM